MLAQRYLPLNTVVHDALLHSVTKLFTPLDVCAKFVSLELRRVCHGKNVFPASVAHES
jgi:hypothetical protein